jgi:signal transduction histidine kinase
MFFKGPVKGTQDSLERELQNARARNQALAELAGSLGATLDYHKVLNAALDVGLLGLKDLDAASPFNGPDIRLNSMVLLFDDDKLRVAHSRGLPQRDQTLTVPGRSGLLGQALETGEPLFADSIYRDPELSYFVALQGTRSILISPLRFGYDNFGLLVFATTKPSAFSPEYSDLVKGISKQAAMAIQNAILYQSLQNEKERIIEVEEEARKKLARDLHDGPTQTVSAIATRVNLMRLTIKRGNADVNQVMAELEKIEEIARSTVKDIRHMLFTLRPLVLESQGIGPALEQLRVKLLETHNFPITVEIQQGAAECLEAQQQGVLFYIIEEAVGNARKHAQTDRLDVRLYRKGTHIVAEVQDYGVGFDTRGIDEKSMNQGSFGMANMRERAQLIGGLLRLESAPGQGTKISVFVPIKVMPTGGGNGQSPRRP